MKKLTKKVVLNTLKNVYDPELHINIVDLGLIRKVIIKKSEIRIVMTLTTIGCPLISVIEDEIKKQLEKIGLAEEQVKIELNFDQPWSIDDMTASARAMLGL